jgi:hypothetical protein
MATELQVRLTGLSAPGRLVEWAQPFPDLESCWRACRSPGLLLWLAARLCTTAQERRAVVACLAELTRLAERGRQRANSPVDTAASTAETWARTGASLEDLLAAERAALDLAAWAGIVAAEKGARARMLLRSAPRSRPASFGASRALGALADWREANRLRRLALAAASTVGAAAEAARAEAAEAARAGADPAGAGATASAADASTPDDSAPDGTGSSPGSWEWRVSESAEYAVGALAGSHPDGGDGRSARKVARLIRRRLPCPRFA